MIKIIVLLGITICTTTFGKSYNFENLYLHARKNHPQGKILTSKIKEVEFGINKIKSDYYPELKATIGGERRQVDADSPLNGERFVAELRIKYNLFRFNQSSDEIKGLEHILKKQKAYYDWWQKNLYRDMKVQFIISQALKEKLSILKKELGANKRLRKSVSKRKKSGLIGKSDLLDIDLRKDQLLSRINILEQRIDHSADKLRRLTFIEHKDNITITGRIPYQHVQLDLKDLIKKAKNNNSKIRASQYAESLHLSKFNKIKKNRLPEVNLSGRYGRMRIDEQYTNDNNQNEGLIGLYVDIPLFDGGQKRTTRQIYQEKYQQKLFETELHKNNEIIELTHKYELLEKTYAQINLLKKSFRRGQAYFTSVLNEYNRGIKNSLDLVSSRDRLLNFHLALINAKEKYLLTILNIEKLTGHNIKEKP